MNAFKTEAAQTRKPRLLLTAAVAAGYATIDKAYEVRKLGPLLNILNLMTYDLRSNWDPVTGHHTAMAGNDRMTAPFAAQYWIDKGFPTNILNLMTYDLHGNWDDVTGHHTAMVGDDKLTVPFAVQYWIDKGFPANKIALGLATYGRAFSLKDPSNSGLGASKQPWQQPHKGQYTREAGFLAYYVICKLGLTVVTKNAAKAPYGHQGTIWVGYDDKLSLEYMVKEVIKSKGLVGAMFWALDLDDFCDSQCGQGKYPLINAVKKYLGDYTPPKPLTQGPQPTTDGPQPPTDRPGPVTKARPVPPTNGPTAPPSGCELLPPYDTNPAMGAWCVANGAAGYCPASHCKCS